MSQQRQIVCNVSELKRNLSKEDQAIFSALEAAGWSIALEDFKYVWTNHEGVRPIIIGPCDDDEEAISDARKIHAQMKQVPAVDDNDPSTAALRHKQEAHEVDLRQKVVEHLEEQGSKPRTDVACQSGVADIATEDAIYEIVCGLNEERLEDIALKLNDYCNEIDSTADAVIITCCAEDMEVLKELEDKYALHIQTLEEFTSPPPKLPGEVNELDQPYSLTGTISSSADAAHPTILKQQMHPAKLKTHPSLLMRAAGLDPEHVDNLEALLKSGGTFKDAVVVFFDGADYFVADGNHRHAAALRTYSLLDVEIHKGTLRDAIIFALRSNAEHGLKLSRDDKRLKAVTLLADSEWFKVSDSQLAAIATGISQQFISGVRRDLVKLLPVLWDESTHGLSQEAEASSDEAIAQPLDLAPGLVKVVRRLNEFALATLSYNIVRDDGKRLGADGVVRSFAKPEEETPLLFEEAQGLAGDSDAVQEVRDRIEAPETFTETSEAAISDAVPAAPTASLEETPESTVAETEESTVAPTDAPTSGHDPLKATSTVQGVAELVRRYEAISLLDLEGLGVERVLINLAERDGLIKRSPAHDDKFVVVKPGDDAKSPEKKPTIEELLKGRPLSISFVYIPGVKGKVNVTVNAGGKPEDASRLLIDSIHVRGFSEPVMQLIFDQLKKRPKGAAQAKRAPAKPTTKKGAAKKAAVKKAVAKKGGAKKPVTSQKKSRARA